MRCSDSDNKLNICTQQKFEQDWCYWNGCGQLIQILFRKHSS